MTINDLIIALSHAVEQQGGARLPDKCQPEPISYQIGSMPTRASTSGCGHEAIFVSTYEPHDREAVKAGAGFVRACAICDTMALWPRYIEQVKSECLQQ